MGMVSIEEFQQMIQFLTDRGYKKSQYGEYYTLQVKSGNWGRENVYTAEQLSKMDMDELRLSNLNFWVSCAEEIHVKKKGAAKRG